RAGAGSASGRRSSSSRWSESGSRSLRGNSAERLSDGEPLVLDAVRHVGVDAEAALPVRFVFLVVAFEPDRLTLALEGEDVRGDPVEEPAVVADHDRAAAELEQRLFEGPQRVHV